MLTKPLLLALLVACGVRSTGARTDPPPEQPDVRPPENVQEGQHWCCQSVDHKTLTGDGCTAISGSLETINACNKVLYCPAAWTKDDGVVTCE